MLGPGTIMEDLRRRNDDVQLLGSFILSLAL